MGINVGPTGKLILLDAGQGRALELTVRP
jgi:hypothetical protein